MIIICGLPNAGKTTYSKKYDNVIHTDSFFNRHYAIEEEVKKRIENNEEVCIEGLCHTAKFRKRLVELCSDNEPKICIWLNTPVEECLRRKGMHNHAIKVYKRVFEPPTLEEGWDEIIII